MAAPSLPCRPRKGGEKGLSHICAPTSSLPPPPITGVLTYKSSLVAQPRRSWGTRGPWLPSGSDGPRKSS